jgi:hypothetical protein
MTEESSQFAQEARIWELSEFACRIPYIIGESELNVSATDFQLPSACLV